MKACVHVVTTAGDGFTSVVSEFTDEELEAAKGGLMELIGAAHTGGHLTLDISKGWVILPLAHVVSVEVLEIAEPWAPNIEGDE